MFPTVLKYHEKKKASVSKGSEETFDALPEIEGFVDIGSVQPIRTTMKSFESAPEIVKDMRFQFKSVLIGVKSCLAALRNIDSQARPSNQISFGIESEILTTVFLHGLDCFEYYFVDSNREGPTVQKDDKEVIEAFSSIFTVIDPALFQEVCCTHIPYLFEKALNNSFIIAIPQFFLSFNVISTSFSAPLLDFLMARFKDVGLADSPKSTVMLRLFKLLFLALSMFPEQNEKVFQPHLANIIMDSLKISEKTEDPMNYFLLLRGLFRSIGGGKFEILYQEVVPLLQVLLESLNSLLSAAHKPIMRELFVELCLTVPVRLSVLLPHLSYLMRPLVIALHAGPELVNQSLKTLELCVDNLNQEFLEPVFVPVKDDLMAALWKHLHPLPYNSAHSHATMRILGKFGGKNRDFLKNQSVLSYDHSSDEALHLAFCMHGSDQFKNLPITKALLCANQTLLSLDSSNLKVEQAFLFSKSCVPLFFDAEYDDNELESTVATMLEAFKERKSKVDSPEPGTSPFQDLPSMSFSRRRALGDALNKLILNLMISATVPDYADDAWSLLCSLIRHFALLDIDEGAVAPINTDIKSPPQVYDVLMENSSTKLSGFLRAIVDALSSERKELREVSERVLLFLRNCYVELLGSEQYLDVVSSFQILALWFGSQCYQPEWFRKTGGCIGLSILTQKISFSTNWMLEHEVEFAKSLLYVLKHVQSESTADAPAASETLMHIIRKCNENQSVNAIKDQSEDNKLYTLKLNSLIAVLYAELSNSNKTVRVTAQHCFSLLAELSNQTVTEILLPVRDRFLYPIFAKPLRALPFALQIGYIDAITYGLTLKPPLVVFTDELGRLIHEALALGDAEDQALTSKDNQYKNAKAMNNLRVKCIELLSAVMQSAEISTPRLQNVRGKIISLLFKCLYSKSKDVIAISFLGLKVLFDQQQKMPKDLLQAGLKPILHNLSDHKKINVAGLKGLGRLLELLNSHFRMEIGKKMLAHLRNWGEPQKLEDLSLRPLGDVEDINIMSEILNVFHMLPTAADVFMDDIITTILDLEAMVHRTVSSPFRKSLGTYLNRFPEESFDYFLKNISKPSHMSLFRELLNTNYVEAFKEEVFRSPEKLKRAIFSEREPPTQASVTQSGISLLLTLSKLREDWNLNNREIVDCALEVWKSRTESHFTNLYARNKQTSSILQLAIIFCNQNHEEVDMLFSVVDGFLDPELTDFSFLKQFIFHTAVESSPGRKRRILKRFLEMYSSATFSIQQKTNIIRHLIIPVLYMTKSGYAEIIDAESIKSMHENIWSANISSNNASEDEVLQMELLQLSTLILYQVPESLKEYLKKVIQYAWKHSTIDDMTIKQSAYVFLCRFIKEYETPAKIVIQTYVAQLKAHQLEIRPMVKQALDNIIPVLSQRQGMGPAENSDVPVWVQWIRKIIIEDGHSVSQLVSIYQFLIRNADHFYDSRELFMPQVVNSLARLGLSGNATAETKTLSVELTSLISKWERKSQQNESGGKEISKMDLDESASASAHQELIITFTIRFCLAPSDPVLHKLLFPKALENLESFFLMWPNALITMTQLEKVASMEITEATINVVINAAEILRVLLRSKKPAWVLQNLSLVQRCIEKWGSFNPYSVNINGSPTLAENAILVQCLSEIISNSVAALETQTFAQSPRKISESVTFYKVIDSKIHEKLKSGSNIEMIACLLKVAYLNRIVDATVSQTIRPYLPDLVKLLQKVVDDNIGSSSFSQQDFSNNVETLILVLNSQILYLGELRKVFLNVISKILEQKDASILHRLLLDLLKRWVDTGSEGFPTMKEKSSLAVKMFEFNSHGNASLFDDYMNFVADLYESGSLARTELTVRLEGVFLEGTRVSNVMIRSRFTTLLNDSISTNMQVRLKYVLGQQNWQSLADSFWIKQALDLLMGSIDVTPKLYNSNGDVRYGFISQHVGNSKLRKNSIIKTYLKHEVDFLKYVKSMTVSDLLGPMKSFIYEDIPLAYYLWTRVFPLCWNGLDALDRHDTVKSLISLLAKDFNSAQTSLRPNVVQALLDGVCRSEPPIQLPPQLVKYLGKTFNAWHIALELLQKSTVDLKLSVAGSSKDDEKIRDSFMDALGDLYSDLAEEDYFAGLWRRRCLFSETNAAISFEQAGMWKAAQKFYEDAQTKARTCAVPFTESEYCLWEKQWIHCTQRLQKWEILSDLSKHDSRPDLLLECAWRLSDWNVDRDSLNMTLQSIAQPSTPRKKFFQAVLILNRISEGQEPVSEFHKIHDEGMQLILKKWHSLPSVVTNAHLSTFHMFQQYVELNEAFNIQSNLSGTTAANIDGKSNDLKNTLMTWRDRLPNVWDDMTIWSDMVAWRQHVFTSINKAYLPLIPQINNPLNGQNPSSSYAYRGYHETAWIINRFANVARKHKLPDVCIDSLAKIYTLPNIEIQEAFFKLREQAKCHMVVLEEYAAGLDVINNTNLFYFNNTQKADFFTLRGVFFSKLNMHEEAVQAFSTAIQVDLNLAAGWANFGEYNDRMFDENPNDVKYAADAVNCYLQASGLFNNGRSRKYLSRILWLLHLDDEHGTVMNAAEAYKAEPPIWFWITFIPELINSLAGKEAKFGRSILIKIAKTYPQALHFQLRTAKEDFAAMKRQSQGHAASASQQNSAETEPKDGQMDTDNPEGDSAAKENQTPAAPWDHIEEIMAILKTAYPLLALTMETMVDQILARLKPTTDEDIYRLIVALLTDGIQMYHAHIAKSPETGGPLSSATEGSLARFADSMVPNHLRYKEAFERDFILSKPTLSQLVERFRSWRDKLEILLDSRPQSHYLEHFTQYLAEFENSKFDDIEVPGQYFQMKSSNKDFVRIEKFDPIVDIFRGHSGSHRRIFIYGHDGSKNSFIIQHPAAKHCRREERTQLLFRLLNETLNRRVESRRRNLQFHLPIIIPLAPQIRLVQDDRSNITLQEIFEIHAKKNGFGKDDPIILYTTRMREVCMAHDVPKKTVCLN